MKFKVAIALAIILAALAAFLVWKFPPAAGPVAGGPRPRPAPAIAAAPKDAAGGPEGVAAPEPAAGVLAVEVVWMNDNSPAADAEIRVRDASGAAEDEAAARTGADGRCRVEVPAASGKVQVTARHAHAPAVSREHDFRKGDVLRIELARDVIAGLVLDAGTGAPVAGARVSLDRASGSAEAVADAEGAWSLVGLGAGAHALRAAAPGYASLTAQPIAEAELALLAEENAAEHLGAG